MKSADRVIIGWLSPGQVDNLFAMRIAELFRERHIIADLMTDECSGLLSRGRNQLVANFLDHPANAQWLLMIDSDQQLSLDGFDKLIAAAHDVERPIVAGLYFGAWPGDFYPVPVPLIFHALPGTSRFTPLFDYPRNQVVEVDSAGTGCLLIHRSVLERIADDAEPEHHVAHYTDGTSKVRWGWFQDMPVRGDWYSEDHFFCTRARSVGFKLHAHTGVVLPHRKRFWLDERHHLMNHPDMLTEEERRSPRWAGLYGTPAEDVPETTEAPRVAVERAVAARPRRKR